MVDQSVFHSRWLAVIFALGCVANHSESTCGAQAIRDGAAQTIEIDKKTETSGRNKKAVYRVPTANGVVTVEESSEWKTRAASDGMASFRTYENFKGGRSAWVTLRGPEKTYVYVDIDGDGRLDVLENRSDIPKSYILVGDRWVEVWPHNLTPQPGDERTSVAKPEVKFIFEKSAWRVNERSLQ